MTQSNYLIMLFPTYRRTMLLQNVLQLYSRSLGSGNQRTQGLSVLLNNTSRSPTAKSLHSQGIQEIICQTSLSNLCIFHTLSETQRKSEGKHVHSTWLNISLLPEWKMQTLVSIKNEDSAGWQPLPLYSHLFLTLKMLFDKCDSPSLEGCPVRFPAQVWGRVWNS